MTDREQKRLSLAFSGGGFRASFYCLGGYRRLVELGMHRLVSQISSVSGGSIAAGAILVAQGLGDFQSVSDFDHRVTAKMVQLGQLRLRRQLHLSGRFLPAWQTLAFTRLLNEILFSGRTPVLQDLPDTPVWSCSATCLNTKKRIVFQKNKLYANLIGESEDTGKIEVSTAIAASAAFPLLFAPLKLRTAGLTFTNSYGWQNNVPALLYLTDGGVYDNLGSGDILRSRDNRSEPIQYLVLDATKEDPTWPLDYRPSRRGLWLRMLDTSLEQNVLQRRGLLTLDKKQEGSQTVGCQLTLNKSLRQTLDSVYRNLPCEKPLPHDPQFDQQVERYLAGLRTDLDGFHDIEIQMLMWAGAIRMDMAIKAMYPDLVAPEQWDEVPQAPSGYAQEDVVKILEKGQQRRALLSLHRKLT